MAGKRLFIELTVGKNQNGTAKKKKFFVKSTMSLHDTMQAMRLASKFQSIEEKEDYIPIDELDEMFNFIVEVFDKQFTQEELERGLPSGEDGFQTIMSALASISNGTQASESKDFLEEKTS